ncbi:N-acetylmuramoyl-L-alanine amidase [Chryseobacterium luquanense]|uniref:N-acetylmuramoyl-L-alanine amidase n=1 Tax=Chryseobacterium luquanense TaxID=2983766 RepID=A0ABT3Y503_9FLAO|nr:N-acetylmuramoyl-L-alanine amidase [Chryseobacterium luquanense]MCX8533192.1 N-acetylmuramoyl-L-alanine amidase [Chryseobacterium luquanense]
MRKHKKISWITELQHKLDIKFGKGLYHAGFLLALFGCLSLTSCQPNSKDKIENVPSETRTTPTTERESPRTKITITNSNQKQTMNNPPNSDFPEGSCVVDAYFARKSEETKEYEKIKSSALGETVYVMVDTISLVGKEISLNIMDKDKIISEKVYEKLSFTDDKNSGDTYKEKVGNDGYAIFKITLKPSKDDKEEKKLAEWRNKIAKASDKKLKLSLKVKAEGDNITYCGKNPDGQTDGRKEDNYWLDTDAKAFIVRRKNPVIVIDPGHGDNNSKNSVFDPGAGDEKEYEKDYALIISKAIKSELDKENIKVYMTREDDINVDPKGPLNWRYESANEKKGDIFVSIHLNSGTDNSVFSVYQQGKNNEINSKDMAQEIMEKLKPLVTVPTNNIRQVKGYTRFNTLAVLNNFKGEAGILMEFGGIGSSTNQQNIKTNKDKIGKAVKDGIISYVEKNF